VSLYQKKHLPTFVVINRPLSASSICYETLQKCTEFTQTIDVDCCYRCLYAVWWCVCLSVCVCVCVCVLVTFVRPAKRSQPIKMLIGSGEKGADSCGSREPLSWRTYRRHLANKIEKNSIIAGWCCYYHYCNNLFVLISVGLLMHV